MAFMFGCFNVLATILWLLLIILLHQVNGEYHYNVSQWGPGDQFNGCDFFRGSWVFDNSYPLYDPRSCPFIQQAFDCVKNGRPDKMYSKFRWKPNGCDFARFNGQDFLQRFRGKRIMFVGDSLSLNQWQSLTCMLHSAVPQARYSLVQRGPLSVLTFPEYEVKIMMLWNAFLVDLVNEKAGRILKLDSINGGNAWRGVDVLIFNTWHHWTHKGRFQKWDYIQFRRKLFKDMNRLVAYKIALETWAQWVNTNVDPSKTRVFFQGISPVHYDGSEWNQPRANCNGQTQPIGGSRYPKGNLAAVAVVKNTLRLMSKPVFLLDITLLSQLRKDGHPSVYTSLSHTGMDCSHWCLAGVPDTWNQLLYAALV